MCWRSQGEQGGLQLKQQKPSKPSLSWGGLLCACLDQQTSKCSLICGKAFPKSFGEGGKMDGCRLQAMEFPNSALSLSFTFRSHLNGPKAVVSGGDEEEPPHYDPRGKKPAERFEEMLKRRLFV